MIHGSRVGVIPLPKAGNLPIVLLALAWAATTACAAPEKPPALSPKDFTTLPFCNTLSTRKLDPKKERIFDELKVTTSNRIRIHGKKVYDAGWVGQALHYHLGKVVLAPWHDRTGTLSAKIPSGSDSISYYIALDMGSALRTKWVTLEKGKTYPWTLKTEAGVRKLAVFDGSKEIAALSAPAADVAGFGFAATARWPGNEVDVAAEFD
jgi:hypothetical protein